MITPNSELRMNDIWKVIYCILGIKLWKLLASPLSFIIVNMSSWCPQGRQVWFGSRAKEVKKKTSRPPISRWTNTANQPFPYFFSQWIKFYVKRPCHLWDLKQSWLFSIARCSLPHLVTQPPACCTWIRRCFFKMLLTESSKVGLSCHPSCLFQNLLCSILWVTMTKHYWQQIISALNQASLIWNHQFSGAHPCVPANGGWCWCRSLCCTFSHWQWTPPHGHPFSGFWLNIIHANGQRSVQSIFFRKKIFLQGNHMFNFHIS